jgi:hypothetical protein
VYGKKERQLIIGSIVNLALLANETDDLPQNDSRFNVSVPSREKYCRRNFATGFGGEKRKFVVVDADDFNFVTSAVKVFAHYRDGTHKSVSFI